MSRLEAMRRALSELGAVDDAELFVTEVERLHVEHEPRTGQHVEARGSSAEVHARVWRGGQLGRASAPLEAADAFARALASAAAGASAGETALAPSPPESGEGKARLTLEPARLLRTCRTLADALQAGPRPVQAFFARQALTRTDFARRSGASASWEEGVEEVLIRVETPQGAVMQSQGAPLGIGTSEGACQRLLGDLDAACAPLESDQLRELDPSAAKLPAMLAPSVAAQLVAALAPLLRADVAAQTLAAHQGKKLFGSCVSLRDEPRHPAGLVFRTVDDEGAAMAPGELVLEGRLLGFLHAAPQLAPAAPGLAARAVRQRGSVIPGWTNLFLVPSPAALSAPTSRLDVTTCVETFSPRPRPGRLDLLVAGWHVLDGQRGAAFGPVSLEGPTLALLRRIQAVGEDLRFHPTADGCGAPSVLVSSLF